MFLFKKFVLASFLFAVIPLYGQELSFVKGSVFFSSDEGKSFRSVKKGGSVAYGSFIRTGEDSLAVLTFPEGSTLKIDPSSEIEIRKVVNEADKKTTNIYHLIKGAIISKFMGAEDRELVVESEHIALAVRGTEFFFGEDDEDYFAAVNSGEVAVVKKGDYDYESLSAGNGLVVENKKGLTKPARYEWANQLSWFNQKEGLKKRSGFKTNKLRVLRRKELRKRLKKLRDRKKKVLSGKFKGRLQSALKNRRLNKKRLNKDKRQLKRTKQRNEVRSGRGKVERFKNRMRNRGVLPRRRRQ